jgi:hypothetical protein
LTVADAFPGVAVGLAGATGVPTVIAAVATELAPVPTAFFAATLNVYAVPFVKAVMTCDTAVPVNVRTGWATAPLNGVTTYPVIAEPPLLAGAVHRTVAAALPGTAAGAVGAPGAAGKVTELEAADATPEPTALRAVTAHVYALPFVSVVTEIGLVVLVADLVTPAFVEVHRVVEHRSSAVTRRRSEGDRRLREARRCRPDCRRAGNHLGQHQRDEDLICGRRVVV